MKVNDAFPSNWLKAADFEDAPKVMHIATVGMEEIKTQAGTEQKLVVRFYGEERGLILNKTNSNTIAKLYGNETDDWIDKRVTLMAMEVQFGLELVWSIRVSSKAPAAAKMGASSKVPPPPPARSNQSLAGAIANEDDEDSIPF